MQNIPLNIWLAIVNFGFAVELALRPATRIGAFLNLNLHIPQGITAMGLGLLFIVCGFILLRNENPQQMPVFALPFIAYCLINGGTAMFNDVVTGGAPPPQAGAIVISLSLAVFIYKNLGLSIENKLLKDYIAKNKPPTEDKHE